MLNPPNSRRINDPMCMLCTDLKCKCYWKITHLIASFAHLPSGFLSHVRIFDYFGVGVFFYQYQYFSVVIDNFGLKLHNMSFACLTFIVEAFIANSLD